VTLLAALVGLLGRRWIATKPRATLGLYAAGWVAVYAVYFVRVGI